MKALRHLSDGAKDRLFPIIAVRPSPRARHLSKTYEKIEEAIGGRRFGYDLDRTKLGSGGDGAAAEFDRLFDPADGHANYFNEVLSVGAAVPILRLSSPINLERQLEHVDRIDRGVIIKVQPGTTAEALDAMCSAIAGNPDVLLVVDAGWSCDLLARQAWASGIIDTITGLIDEPEVVVMGSSFPDSFGHIKRRGQVEVLERTLHSNLVRRHNQATLVYGDWGSTRPPVAASGPMRNTPRIDLPNSNEWVCFRKVDDEGYAEIAQRLLSDPAWSDDPATWGAYTIGCTAAGIPGAIRSPGTAAAARINIHLHQQAYAGNAEATGDGEEPYVDL